MILPTGRYPDRQRSFPFSHVLTYASVMGQGIQPKERGGRERERKTEREKER